MNELQLCRWKELSLGLARTYKELTPRRSQKLLSEVNNCIEWVVCNGLETVEDWDRSVKTEDGYYECAGDRVDQYLWDERYEFERRMKNGHYEIVCGRFGIMLSSCVRAGFDMSVAQSGGVIGFTIGDLRDSFEGTIPDWIADQFGGKKEELLNADRDDGVWL